MTGDVVEIKVGVAQVVLLKQDPAVTVPIKKVVAQLNAEDWNVAKLIEETKER